MKKGHDTIVILDFGSQYTQLICRRIRECGVFAVILPFSATPAEIRSYAPKGIILSGGPAGVYEPDAPKPDHSVWEIEVPLLGICYGLQLLAHTFGGTVLGTEQREYGHAELNFSHLPSPLFGGITSPTSVWMSHGDTVLDLPKDFKVIGSTDASTYAAVNAGRFYGVQFHPEVAHTPEGSRMLHNFAIAICGCRPTWIVENEIDDLVADIRAKVGKRDVLLAVSGGVDSTVLALLLKRAIGNRLHCVTIDTGLLRLNELKEVTTSLAALDLPNLSIATASNHFLRTLNRVVEPEAKRRIIGDVYTDELLKRLEPEWILSQGTLYPDTIESVSVVGPASRIKTHHNLVAALRSLGPRLIEPLRFFFKDEVRRIGKALNVPSEILGRHPFPGPGLAIRILGEVTPERLEILRRADAIFLEEIRHDGLYDEISQAFAALEPAQTVGVTGDSRREGSIVLLRAVVTPDFMTASPYEFTPEFLRRATRRIVNEIKEIVHVAYIYTEKPPSTIELQ